MKAGRTHIYIPDTQHGPGRLDNHLWWIGEYIAEEYDGSDLAIIHAGDHADMPSLSSYDKGKKAMEGRRYDADIEAANHGFDCLNTPLLNINEGRRKKWEPERYITLGNHEDRISRAVEADPQLDGAVSLDHLNYADWGWTVLPFLEPINLDGVVYAHYFYNPMSGRPYAGTNVETRIKTIGHSFTMGHQQTLMYGLRFLGDGRSQHGLVAGACYLHDETYKGPQGNAHWRGIVVCHQVENGSYDPMFVSLDYLCRRFEGMTLAEFKQTWT